MPLSVRSLWQERQRLSPICLRLARLFNVVNGQKSSSYTSIIGPAIVQQPQHIAPPQALGPLMEPTAASESAGPEENSESDLSGKTQSQVCIRSVLGLGLLLRLVLSTRSFSMNTVKCFPSQLSSS